VNPSITSNHLEQTVTVGGFQLGKLTVIQQHGNRGMGIPKTLKHLCVGGIARLGFFLWGQPQVLK
jgi:hypothetical protein